MVASSPRTVPLFEKERVWRPKSSLNENGSFDCNLYYTLYPYPNPHTLYLIVPGAPKDDPVSVDVGAVTNKEVVGVGSQLRHVHHGTRLTFDPLQHYLGEQHKLQDGIEGHRDGRLHQREIGAGHARVAW